MSSTVTYWSVVIAIVSAVLIQVSPGEAATLCPAGHYCPSGSSAPQPCAPGTHGIPGGQLPCRSCASGYYQDKSGQKACLLCPEGYSCADPKTSPSPCPPGTASQPYYSRRTTCAACSSGYYQDKSGQKQCLLCPEGHSCADPKKQSVPCPPGKVSQRYFSHRTTCADCNNGYFQDKPGQRYCMMCPSGSYCPAPRNRAIPCPVGTVSAHYTNQRVSCRACSDGKYQDKIGQSRCLLCPEGRQCPSPKNGPIPCPPGYQSNYYRSISHLVKCLACQTGYYQTRAEQSRCIVCPTGYSCPQKEKAPVPCPPGFQSSSTLSRKPSCWRCSSGRCLGPVTPPVVCQAGTYLSTSGICQPCAAGQYQVHSGQSSCQICPEGSYCPTATGKPLPCPIGTYSTIEVGPRTACRACSSGTYQTQEGQNVCLQCPVGHFCTKPGVNPVPCPAGTYSSTTTTDRTKCLPCSDQEYQDQTGQERCMPCPDGYHCPRADLSPQQCPPNTFNNEGLRGKCLPCPNGHYQDQCGQTRCKLLFADGTSPPLGPSSSCPTLVSSVVVTADFCSDSARGAYSGASMKSVEGNNGVPYPVVKIRPEHLPPGETVIDDHIQVSTALAFERMATDAKTQGVTLLIRSGFRTYKRQQYVYNCFKTKSCNGGNVAAVPGTSKHGSGVALDLNTNCGRQAGNEPPPACAASKVYTWLKTNGHKFGFVRTVKVEPWHWEFQGGPVSGPSSFT